MIQAPARKRLLVLLAITGFCVMVASLILWSNSRSLTYQGKTVKAWLLQLSAADAKARAEAEAAFQAMGTKAVPELARLLRADDARWRKLTWAHMSWLPRRMRGPVLERVSTLNAYLMHPAAARALGRLGPGAAAAEPDLVRALQDKVNGTYWEAGRALGRIGKPAVPDLMQALLDKDTLVRCAAANGLGEAGADAAPAVAALVQMMKRGSENEQQTATRSLGQIGDPAVAPLIDILAQEQGATRDAAVKSLLQHYQFPTMGRPAREHQPGDEAAPDREQAMQMLGASDLPAEVVVKVLSGAAVKDPAAGVRVAALKALAHGNRNVRSALPALVACSRDESPAVREWAVRTLGKIGLSAKPVVPLLSRAAQDKEESVRAAAKEALEAIRTSGTNDTHAGPR